MKKKSLFFRISQSNILLRKLYFFYNIYIRNSKYLNNSSQFGEDEIILNLFEKDYVGFYLDIGCYHPTKHNNTYKMYKRGWTGINVDLNPFTIELFNFFRKRDLNINAAISDDENTKELYFLNELNTENTIDPNHIDFLKKNHNVQDHEITKKNIKSKTFSQIINVNDIKRIDFFNLDVEGHELNILKTIDFEKLFINVICIEMIEHNNISIKNNSEIKNILKKNNYTLVDKIDINHIYKKKFNHEK